MTEITQPQEQPLDVFFAPKNVAVIGASETPGTVGRTILWNLITSPFGGTVFPVNPKHTRVLGIKAYPEVREIPEKIDLAVVVTPPQSVPGVIRMCGEAGVRGAIVITAGFKESGPAGVELEKQVLGEARRGGVRIVGPNCLGIMCPLTGLNATFAGAIARPGNVGFISQSGALCTAVLDWSLRENVGFSAFVSVGSMVDVGWGDLIYYLGNDPRTHSIVIYMESIGDARSFLSAAREVALNKPIIVIKAGRTAAAAKAAASHTGSLAGSDEVLDAAFRRTGVLRVSSIAELFNMSGVLAKQPTPQGPRLSIVTNAGGPGVLATDALILGGGELAEPGPETMSALNSILPATWSHGNPIDVIGDASADRYCRAVEIAAKDPGSDGLLVILTPQAMTDPTQTAERIKEFARLGKKPILASWMGGADVESGTQILNRANIPTFAYPDTAVRAFNYMWRYAYNLKGLYETPSLAEEAGESVNRERAEAIVRNARESRRSLLTEWESKELLGAYGIPTVRTLIARDQDESVACAKKIGFPVVLKLHSETLTHKTDVGGVKLHLRDESAVRRAWSEIRESVTQKAGAEHFLGVTVQEMIQQESSDGYEIILGSTLDVQFGPVLLFGAGGQLVEVFRDRALALPPLNTVLARRTMEQTKIYRALQGIRGRKSVDMQALERLLVRFSQLVVEQPWIREIDINPLFVSPTRIIALDARVILHDPKTTPEKLPKAAIRPYPIRYCEPFTLKTGKSALIRPIRPEDEPLMIEFHRTLSERSVFLRYLKALSLEQRISHEQLMRNCFIDYDREMALVAEGVDPTTGNSVILAVGRLRKATTANIGSVALVVGDRWQGGGLGQKLMSRLVDVGRDEKLSTVRADIIRGNQAGIRLCQGLGFKITDPGSGEVVRAEYKY